MVRRDNRAGSIEKDPDYKKFLESIENPAEVCSCNCVPLLTAMSDNVGCCANHQKLPSAEEQLDKRLEAGEEEQPIAPLVAYVLQKRAKKAAQRAAKKVMYLIFVRVA